MGYSSDMEHQYKDFTLGSLIKYLDEKHELFADGLFPLFEPHSYRGNYADLGLSIYSSDMRIRKQHVDGFRLQLKDCLGAVFEGYKGGLFTMHKEVRIYITLDVHDYSETDEPLTVRSLYKAFCPTDFED